MRKFSPRIFLSLGVLGCGLLPAAEASREPAPGAASQPAVAPVDRDLQETPVSPEQWQQFRQLRLGAFAEYALPGGIKVRHEVEAVSPEAVIVRSVSAGTRLRFRYVPRRAVEAGSGAVAETLTVAGKPVAAERTERKVEGVVRGRLWTSREIPILGGGVVRNEVNGAVIVELTDFAFSGPAPRASAAAIDSGKTVDTTVPREQWELYRKLQVGAFAEYKSYGTVTRHEVLQAEPEAVVFQTTSAGTTTRTRAMPPPEEVITRRTETLTVAGKPVVAERAETTSKGVVVARVWTSRDVPIVAGGVVRQESYGEVTQDLLDFSFGK